MIFSVETNNRTYKIDAENAIDISIPLDFNGAQPNAFDVEQATATACETGAFVGDTRRGGSCNFEQIKFIPHCNGTHTESIGHITDERISIHNCLKDAFVFAALVSVEPENAKQSDETYAVELNESDKLITRKSLENCFSNLETFDFDALIIRTLPNDAGKKTRRYMEDLPPFFSTEAINFIAASGVKHLLVDIPSIDRTFDEGKLSNHRIFWKVEAGSRAINEASLIYNTITEMIYVPDQIKDETYLLNLQIASFVADASPSRPLLFEIYE